MKPISKITKRCDLYDPLVFECSECPEFNACRKYLEWYSRIPHFIIDDWIKVISPSAWKVFTFLNRKANFEKGSNHYGRCWLTYEQIEEGTGVKKSNMRKYIIELKDYGLINYSWSKHGGHEGVKTTHEYKITWLTKMQKMSEHFDKKKAALTR